MADDVLFPGSTVGIIGDSPNGIMLARAAKKLGFKVVVYCTQEGNPALAEADVPMVGRMDDQQRIQDFAQRCDAVTYESEAVPLEAVEVVSKYTQVPQGTELLEITQDRLLERAFYDQLNVNIAPYATIITLDDVYQAVTSIGYPCVLKPVQKRPGDGRFMIIKRQTDITKCAGLLEQGGTFILETWVPFAKELSVIVTRDGKKAQNYFPIIENIYHNGRLHETLVPAQIDRDVEKEIQRLSMQIVQQFKARGTFEISYFMTADGMLYVKRIVPAPSMPGYVFDAAMNISMFAQHIRAIANMPLARTEILEPTAMVIVEQEDMPALRTQWVLKSNWRYNFFRYPQSLQGHRPLGYLLVMAPTIKDARDQIDSTAIWDAMTKQAE